MILETGDELVISGWNVVFYILAKTKQNNKMFYYVINYTMDHEIKVHDLNGLN